MVFWSKGPESKEEKILENRKLQQKVRAHQLHMQQAEAMAEVAEQSTGYGESKNSGEGIDQDAISQLGSQTQKAKEFVHARSKQLRGMRAKVRSSRKKASARGRSLGF